MKICRGSRRRILRLDLHGGRGNWEEHTKEKQVQRLQKQT